MDFVARQMSCRVLAEIPSVFVLRSVKTNEKELGGVNARRNEIVLQKEETGKVG